MLEPKGKGGRAGLWGTGNLHYRASGGHPMLVETIGVLECSCGHFRQNVTAFSQAMQIPCREEAETRGARWHSVNGSIPAFSHMSPPPMPLCPQDRGVKFDPLMSHVQHHRCRAVLGGA